MKITGFMNLQHIFVKTPSIVARQTLPGKRSFNRQKLPTNLVICPIWMHIINKKLLKPLYYGFLRLWHHPCILMRLEHGGGYALCIWHFSSNFISVLYGVKESHKIKINFNQMRGHRYRERYR